MRPRRALPGAGGGCVGQTQLEVSERSQLCVQRPRSSDAHLTHTCQQLAQPLRSHLPRALVFPAVKGGLGWGRAPRPLVILEAVTESVMVKVDGCSEGWEFGDATK